MKTLDMPGGHGQYWKFLYKAAISTSDLDANGLRITAAEDAILGRTRELLDKHGTEVDVERDALEDALYILGALRTTTALSTAA
jgi:hypothetical protein